MLSFAECRMLERSAPFPSISLAVITPMANERATAERFVREVAAECAPFGFSKFCHFVILDRVSTDGTFEFLRAVGSELPSLKVVYAPENRTVVDAYLRGYREALASGSSWILEIDAGFSHSPQDIPVLFQAMSAGYDCVFGSRFCAGGHMLDAPLRRYLISKGGSVAAKLLLGTKLSDMTSGFELFTREALEAILARGILSRGPFFQTEIKAFARGMKICEVPIQYRSPSHVVGSSALQDALAGLHRLFRLRLRNAL
jgi:dolichol-phosphate mannosyltransferase